MQSPQLVVVMSLRHLIKYVINKSPRAIFNQWVSSNFTIGADTAVHSTHTSHASTLRTDAQNNVIGERLF